MDVVNDTTAFDQADVNKNSNFQEFDGDMIESPLVSQKALPEVIWKYAGVK